MVRPAQLWEAPASARAIPADNARGKAYRLAQSGSKMPQELIDETSWVRESNQVAACQLNYGDAQPLLCHAPLKLDWKQTVITARNHAYRNIRPGLKTARVAEYRIGLLALMRFALLDDIGRNVVEEIGGEIEVDTVPAAVSCLRPCSCSPGVFPPFTGRLARSRDHRVDENQHAHGNALANQRGGETAKRLCNEDRMAGADRLYGEIGISGEAGIPVVAG